MIYAHEEWQCGIIKNADNTVMMEKLNTLSEDKILFQNWVNMNHLDCNYARTKFVLFEKRSVKHPNIITGIHEIASYKYLGIQFDKKLNFNDHRCLAQLGCFTCRRPDMRNGRKKFKIADLHIFGTGEIIDLIYN